MPATRAESIVDHIAANVVASLSITYDGTPSTTVARLRAAPYGIESLPAVVFRAGDDSMREGSSNMAFIDRDLQVEVDLYVDSNDQYYAHLDLLRHKLYLAIMADRTLGLAYVLDVQPVGDSEPEIDTLGKTTMKQTMSFLVHYRHAINNSGA